MFLDIKCPAVPTNTNLRFADQFGVLEVEYELANFEKGPGVTFVSHGMNISAEKNNQMTSNPNATNSK